VRALAVAMVVVYHLYPSLVPGGFAGVDVFFVISGFLITGHLTREYQKTGTVSLVDFWGRRAKRLIPAAVLVLTVTWVVSLRVLTAPQLADTADQIRASALYFQNWQLAHDAVDYLKSTDAASPVQHFWSLSVEEQFYLLWPLLFLVAALIIRLTRPMRRIGAHRARPPASAGGNGTVARGGTPGYAIIAVLATVLVLVSLAYSYLDTRANPDSAYFVTTTRIWELGVGGLLALIPKRIGSYLGRQGWLGWTGLAMVITSAFVLNGAMAFPGLVALLPVGGAVLLIGAGPADARFGPGRLMSLRPLVFIGGISYSLYLWHWPIISLWTSYRGHAVGRLSGPAIVAVSILLAWLTKIGVEDPVRKAHLLSGHGWRSVATALAAVLPVVLVTGYLVTRPAWDGQLGPGYPGAAALASPGQNYTVKPVQPAADSAGSSLMPTYWQKGCLEDPATSAATACVFGDTSHPRLTVALVGDSIAGNWFQALNVIAEQEHWRIVTELHGECTWTSTLTWYGSADGHPYTVCQTWGATVLHDLTTTIHPDVVITSGSSDSLTPDHLQTSSSERAEVGAGMAVYWKQLIAHGIPVVAIDTTPHLTFQDLSCVLKFPSDYDTKCVTPRSTALTPDESIYYAARLMQGQVPVIDMNSFVCELKECQGVVGNVLAYFDNKHFTASFSQTLAPFLKQRLLAASPVLRAASQ
jgi:peptidoglycan/LPS O-acetylase OafA/YrhL